MPGKNQHVVPHPRGWAVRGAGNDRVSSTHDTQRAAYGAARATAKQQRSEVLVHGENGRIRARDSFGKDPYPPKG